MKQEIKWATLDNYTGTSTLKQHAFKSITRRRKYSLEQYSGNISLCGKINCSSDGEYSDPLERIEGEPVNTTGACKLCLTRLESDYKTDTATHPKN
jgi:hypothetical protein